MNGFFPLALEALRDAGRRRIVVVVAILSLLSLWFVDGCTACATGSIVVNGQEQQLGQMAGYGGAAMLAVLGLWCTALAGVLASEHLAQTLSDGSAPLALARPISRTSFAAARLAGALAIAWVTSALLIGATALLLARRGELPIAPACLAGLAVLVGGTTVGALSMTASLYLPRVACMLLALGGVGALAIANGLRLASPDATGVLAWLDRLGPPLLTAIALPLDAWLPDVSLTPEPALVWIKHLAWAIGSIVILGVAFRRHEIR